MVQYAKSSCVFIKCERGYYPTVSILKLYFFKAKLPTPIEQDIERNPILVLLWCNALALNQRCCKHTVRYFCALESVTELV